MKKIDTAIKSLDEAYEQSNEKMIRMFNKLGVEDDGRLTNPVNMNKRNLYTLYQKELEKLNTKE